MPILASALGGSDESLMMKPSPAPQAFLSLRELPAPQHMEALTAHWEPYRSVGRWGRAGSRSLDAAVGAGVPCCEVGRGACRRAVTRAFAFPMCFPMTAITCGAWRSRLPCVRGRKVAERMGQINMP